MSKFQLQLYGGELPEHWSWCNYSLFWLTLHELSRMGSKVVYPWDSVSGTAAGRLEAVQRRATRLECGIRRTDRKTSTTSLLQKLNLQPLSDRRSDRRLKIFSQYHHSSKAIISNYIQRASYSSARKHAVQYFIPQSNTLHFQRSFFIRTAKDWNTLPADSPLLVPPCV